MTCPIIFLLQQETQQNKTTENIISRICILLLKNWNVFMDIHMSLVKGSINPYLNPRMIFLQVVIVSFFFQKFIRDVCVLRDTRNAVQFMMICSHDTVLLCVTNRHVFSCYWLISKHEKMRPLDFSLHIFYMPCAMSYTWLTLTLLKWRIWWTNNASRWDLTWRLKG